VPAGAHGPGRSVKLGTRPAPSAVVAGPVARPPSSAYRIWASIGAVFLAIQGWTWLTWLADAPGQITRFRDTSAPSWKWAIALQVFQVVSTAGVLVAVVRHARRKRVVTLNLLYVAGCLCLVWLDPMLNYFRIGFFYSSNFINVESWLGHIPGQIAPYVNITPQPLLWEAATYTGVFILFTLLLVEVWRRLARRFPEVGGPLLFAGTEAVAILLNLVLELPFVRTGLFAYPAASHRFALWGGETYQFPLVESLGASLFWTASAALFMSMRSDGLTAVERGIDGVGSARRRTGLRFLAVTGYLHVIFLVFPMGLAQLGPFYTDRFPPGYAADLHNGWCGDDGQPYGPCPGPGVPWAARAGGDPEPADVYRRFEYFGAP
jgi:hypothetical protein